MDNLRSKLGFSLFFILIIFLLVGGYIFTNYIVNNKDVIEEKEKISYKIDEDKDYIYYINEEEISEEAEIDYKDVVININTQKELNTSLNKENAGYKESIQYIKDNKDKLPSTEVIKYNYNDLYYLSFRRYQDFKYNNYISLLIQDYNYSCFDYVTFKSSKAYVFNIDNGKLLSVDELLDNFKSSKTYIENSVKTFLEGKQTTSDGVDVIKIDDTINNIDFSNLFINNYGKLSISILVKTTQTDYNEIVEV